MARWQNCNILKTAGTRQLWQFTPTSEGAKLQRETTPGPDEPLPAKIVGKEWSSLWKKKLNVAWMPPGTVYLRVVQLPASDPGELASMVEFQLEKISPLPVNQIDWMMEVLPGQVEGQQTVIVMLAQRSQVESFLGILEGQGFIADRLEVPLLDQLLANKPETDGVYIYASQEGLNTAWLVAWWLGGTLRHLGVIQLPNNNEKEAVLKAQLKQMTWAGELEGWMNIQPRWFLVADTVTASMFTSTIREALGEEPTVVTPPPMGHVAATSAVRAMRSERLAGLLPPEIVDRYHALFVDRLWMSFIVAGIMTYLVATLAYFGYLEVLKYQLNHEESRVAAVSGSYTNVLQIKAQTQVLQDQQSFKYAALECWEATARNLPEELILTSMSLSRERTLTLFGNAPQEASAKVTEFNGALKKSELSGRPLFSKVNAPNMSGRQGGNINWSFTCELNRLEKE
jgi:hypothetical protein